MYHSKDAQLLIEQIDGFNNYIARVNGCSSFSKEEKVKIMNDFNQLTELRKKQLINLAYDSVNVFYKISTGFIHKLGTIETIYSNQDVINLITSQSNLKEKVLKNEYLNKEELEQIKKMIE